MVKSKPLTQQELYRQRKKREERERVAYLPPGLVNHGNTCFMNSVLQGLLATQLLSDLAYFNPINPEIQKTAALPIVPSRSPQLMNGHSFAGHHKLPPVGGMPIGDVFLDTLDRAWFAQAYRRRDIHSPRALLTTLGRKYDQYLDFAQQDAHEFLRILLDAMRMEEFDIIKVRQPPPPKKRRRTTITPASIRSSQERRSEPLQISSSVTPPNSNAPTTPLTNGVLPDEKLPLISFVDMIFGGQLTSILVCQKCKHVSQTYEDFNDISLSLKPEDYRSHRHRERFKKLVGRLTSFPSTSSGSHAHGKEKPPLQLSSNAPSVQNHTVEKLHSSSLPSMGSKGSDGVSSGSGPEEPLLTASGKKGLDLNLVGGVIVIEAPSPSTVETQGQVNDAGFQEERDNDEAESDSSHIIVNVTGPEDRHVEFVEPKRDKEDGMGDQETKERKHDEAAWARLGRRISLNLGLGRQKDKEKDKRERERKTRSMDRTPLTFAIKEGEYFDTQVMQKSLSVGARPSTPSTSNLPKNRVSSESAARDVESSQRLPRQLTPFTTATSKQVQPPSQDSTSSIAPKFHTVQRSRSPKPPKPTTAETQYLRKVLADVSPPSSNPLLMLRPSLLHSHSSPDHLMSRLLDKEKEKNLGPMWLGLGARPFTGIEECLRMFTAVEVLDGDNMVGCRRCWKIQNGLLQSKKNDSDQEDEEDEGDEVPFTVPITPSVEFPKSAEGTRPPLKVLQPSLSIGTSSPVHIQASQSTPTVSFYSQTDSRSLSSLPTSLSDANLSTLHARRAEENSSDSALSLSVISEGSVYSTTTENNGVQLQGPGGLPIPIISTTPPIDAHDASTPTPSESSSESHYSSASEGQVSPSPSSQEQRNRETAYARLTGAMLNERIREPHQASYSRDSLVIPPKSRYGNRKTTSETSTDDGNSGDETDTSIGTSVSADSLSSASYLSDATGAETSGVSRRMYDAQTSTTATSEEPSQSSSSQHQLPEPGRPQKKPSKPKPVIMRPAYKRYLIDTPPPVLVVHLKRFQQTSKAPLMLSFSNGFKKLDDYVSFPEFLDLSPFLAPRKEDYGLGKKSRERTKEKGTQNAKNKMREERCMYRLYAVVVHIGNMLGGHYIAYTALPSEPPMHRSSNKSSSATPSDDAAASTLSQVQPDGDKQSTATPPSDPTPLAERQWAYISDTVVRLTTLEEVLSSKAYVCMYERC